MPGAIEAFHFVGALHQFLRRRAWLPAPPAQTHALFQQEAPHHLPGDIEGERQFLDGISPAVQLRDFFGREAQVREPRLRRPEGRAQRLTQGHEDFANLGHLHSGEGREADRVLPGAIPCGHLRGEEWPVLHRSSGTEKARANLHAIVHEDPPRAGCAQPGKPRHFLNAVPGVIKFHHARGRESRLALPVKTVVMPRAHFHAVRHEQPVGFHGPQPRLRGHFCHAVPGNVAAGHFGDRQFHGGTAQGDCLSERGAWHEQAARARPQVPPGRFPMA